MTIQQSIQKRLIPLTSFPYEPDIASMKLTESKVRWWVFNRHTNGFNRCLKRVGRRLFIDPDQFFMWIDEQSLEN